MIPRGAFQFGWLSEPRAFGDDTLKVEPLDDYQRRIDLVRSDTQSGIGKNWISPRMRLPNSVDSDVEPLFFELPATHQLEADNLKLPEAEFLVLVLGFLLGVRLSIHGGSVWRLAWRLHTLVGFVPWSNKDVLRCLLIARSFWRDSSQDVRKKTFSAIHWFLVGQSYAHQFEEFSWQYTVLDTLHNVTHKDFKRCTCSRGNCHATRPECLSRAYGSGLPISFSDQKQNAGRLVDLRNELIHEARWLGEPLGYRASEPGHELLEDLKHFNSQIILGVLGIECGFRKQRNCWQTMGLDLSK